ncbi:MAG TPA: branched-chain amino acid ABC transporter permease LivH, partial [Thauera sp.]|nr:branched-chain amino acid ABC transporter permease LivH [Thauera sp.]
MAYALQQLINGLTLGAMYGLIAIGYTMVYGIIGMINFAHGDIFMVSAFIAVTAFTILAAADVTSIPLALTFVLIVSIFFTSAYGWAVERTAYRPLRGSTRLAPLISAIGMSIFLQNSVQLTQGARVKPIPPVLEGGIVLWDAPGFTVQIGWSQMLIIVTTVILMTAFTWMITQTPFGRQQRACEQDRTMAS